MKFELLIFGLTAFFVMNVYNDGKYTQMLKSYKKYYQMLTIAFVGLSAYVFLRKYPGHSRSLFTHANSIIKYLPIDKEAGELLAPLFDLTKPGMYPSAPGMYPSAPGSSPQETRLLNSGGASSKRCVSETKKKYVAAQQNWTCGDCKKQLPAWFEVDHKLRLDRGGTNHVDNLVALCRDCHGKKTAFENL